MASGYKVVPVRAQAWKSAMGISGREYTKVSQSASLTFQHQIRGNCILPFHVSCHSKSFVVVGVNSF